MAADPLAQELDRERGLDTEHVYNEISAQAAGATHFAPDVDTIFEIGGQDAKYIYLRNGVPIDYAMNNACSAGTGPFLEESAQGDLGIGVSDIADLALAAAAPVQFKATCAAFINSDIRLAQQEGHSRDNIVAGLVYAIAGNYLNRVKGARCVGRKVFLQGGVALNRAVAHAFAHSVGRQIVIPRNPELLGAMGVALLALQRAGQGRSPDWKSALQARRPDAAADLLALARAEMKLVGRFTCGACKLACSIDRFEVAGRRFPFGGRCSLYENVWKRKSRTAPAPDLVEQRAKLLFGSTTQSSARPRHAVPGAMGAQAKPEHPINRRDAMSAELQFSANLSAAPGRAGALRSGGSVRFEPPAIFHRHSAGADDALVVSAVRDFLFQPWAGGGVVQRGPSGRTEVLFRVLPSGADRAWGIA